MEDDKVEEVNNENSMSSSTSSDSEVEESFDVGTSAFALHTGVSDPTGYFNAGTSGQNHDIKNSSNHGRRRKQARRQRRREQVKSLKERVFGNGLFEDVSVAAGDILPQNEAAAFEKDSDESVDHLFLSHEISQLLTSSFKRTPDIDKEEDPEMQRVLEESYKHYIKFSTVDNDDLHQTVDASNAEKQQGVDDKRIDTELENAMKNGLDLEDSDEVGEGGIIQKFKQEDEIARRILSDAIEAEKQLERARKKSEDEETLLEFQLNSIKDLYEPAVIDETRKVFVQMRRKYKVEGGRPPDFDYALSLAQDREKERSRNKLDQAKQKEEEAIKERNNEDRATRAARFAAAFEKKLQSQNKPRA